MSDGEERVRATASGRLGVLAAAALFSTGGAVIKAVSLTAWQVACLRSVFAALTIFLLLPAARRAFRPRTVAVAVTYAATLVLFVQANKLTTAASAIFLQSTAPLYVLLLSPWLLKERIRRLDLLYMLVLAVGLGLLLVGLDPASATAPEPLAGNLLATCSGMAWAATIMGLRWLAGKDEREGRDAGGSGAAAAVVGNVLAFLACLPWALPMAPGPVDWLAVLFLGAVQVGLAYVFLIRAIAHVPALEASLLLLLEPVLNPIWAWLAHGERPGAWSLAGGLLILAATAGKSWLDARGTAPAPVQSS